MLIGHSFAQTNVREYHVGFLKVNTLLLFGLFGILFEFSEATQLIQLHMKEEEVAGYVVGILYKFIPDAILTEAGVLLFRLVDEGDSAYFDVGSNDGRIQITQQVDRETICPYGEYSETHITDRLGCNMEITVNLLRQHESSTTLVDVIQVIIYLDDIDDHSCEFVPSENQNIEIKENVPVQTSYRLNRLQDLDTGIGNGINPNTIKFIFDDNVPEQEMRATLELRLRNSSSVVSPYVLDIVLQKPLDYETRHFYRFKVQASGFNHVTCVLNVNLQLVDVNDNPPRFIKYNTTVHILETTDLRKPIITLHAADADSDPAHRKLFYHFDSTAPPQIRSKFQIDQHLGAVFLRSPVSSLEYPVFHIPFIVTNSPVIPETLNQNQLIDKLMLTVKVIRVMRKSPIISVFTLDGQEQISIPEHSAHHPYDFAVVTASNEDAKESKTIECHLRNEDTTLFSLTRIHATEQQSSDEQKNLINEAVYKLSALHPFDRELIPIVSIKILCDYSEERGFESGYDVHIWIKDINDHRPKFNKTHWQFTILEDSDPSRRAEHYYIGQVTATDQDSADNGKITYHIEEKSLKTYLNVDKHSGVISSTGKLDRETLDYLEFVIVACDGGDPAFNDTTNVTISIMDFNDNLPAFSQDSYTFFVEENNKHGNLIGDVHVSDKDLGLNSFLQFRLKPVTNSKMPYFVEEVLPFELASYFDSVLRVYEVKLYASRTIDREHLNTNHTIIQTMNENDTRVGYQFWLVAEDAGKPKLTNRAMIHVFIKDVNDEAPVFRIPSINGSSADVSYREKVGNIIFRVHAVDNDAGSNGTVRYKVKQTKLREVKSSANPISNDTEKIIKDLGKNNPFNIHQSLGLIYLIKNLQAEDIGNVYQLELEAHDLGTAFILSSTITLLFRVTTTDPVGYNHNMDEFFNSNHNGQGDETTDSGLNFYIILAIILAAFLTSASMLIVFWIMLHRRKRRRSIKSVRAISNGHVFHSRSTAQNSSQQDSVDGTSWIRESVGGIPHTVTKTEYIENSEWTAGHTARSEDSELVQLVDLSTCIGLPWTKTQQSTLPLLYSLSEFPVSSQYFSISSVNNVSCAQPMIVCAAPIQPNYNELQPTSQGQTEEVHIYQHSAELQHFCLHQNETIGKCTSSGSLDHDSGKGDSLDANPTPNFQMTKPTCIAVKFNRSSQIILEPTSDPPTESKSRWTHVPLHCKETPQ